MVLRKDLSQELTFGLKLEGTGRSWPRQGQEEDTHAEAADSSTRAWAVNPMRPENHGREKSRWGGVGLGSVLPALWPRVHSRDLNFYYENKERHRRRSRR